MIEMDWHVVILLVSVAVILIGGMALASQPNVCPKCNARRGYRLLAPDEIRRRLSPELDDTDPMTVLAAETFYTIQAYAECKGCKKIVVRC